MSDTFLRPKQAAAKAGLSISHLYRLVAEDKFPQPIRISERITAFAESEIDTWIIHKIHSARGTAPPSWRPTNENPEGDLDEGQGHTAIQVRPE